MRPGAPRRTGLRVRDGRVRWTNRHAATPTYWNTRQAAPVIDRERPGRGYRHLLRPQDVERFLDLLPDADAVLDGLDAIVLAAGSSRCDGWYRGAVVGITAWPRELEQRWSPDAVADHADVLAQLGVPTTLHPGGDVLVGFTEASARAYQLVHVLLHELGHHRDRMTSRRQVDCGRGEGFAEDYALRHGAEVWTRYADAFGW